MRKTNILISIVNIIFCIVSSFIILIVEQTPIFWIVQASWITYIIAILFSSCIIAINIYIIIKNNNNDKKIKLLFILNSIFTIIISYGTLNELIGRIVLLFTDFFYSVLYLAPVISIIINIIILIISIKITETIYINKVFFSFIILQIILSLIVVIIGINMIEFEDIDYEIKQLSNSLITFKRGDDDDAKNEVMKKLKEINLNDKVGLLNEKNKLIVEPNYEFFYKCSIPRVFFGYKNNSVDVITTKGEILGTFKNSIFFKFYKQDALSD